MALIMDIRGTHGSGKSHIVHSLLERWSSEDLIESGKPVGHLLPEIDLAIVGRYKNQCGGCDGVKTANEVVRRIRWMASNYLIVVFEGIFVSHTFGRYNDLALDLESNGHRYLFMFLDTPLDTCIRRVVNRRQQAGNVRPFNPHNTEFDHKRVWGRFYQKFTEAGRNTAVINHKKPLSRVLLEIDHALGKS